MSTTNLSVEGIEYSHEVDDIVQKTARLNVDDEKTQSTKIEEFWLDHIDYIVQNFCPNGEEYQRWTVEADITEYAIQSPTTLKNLAEIEHKIDTKISNAYRDWELAYKTMMSSAKVLSERAIDVFKLRFIQQRLAEKERPRIERITQAKKEHRLKMEEMKKDFARKKLEAQLSALE